MTADSERAELLRAYAIYDTANDIVSAFEALFTKQADFAPRVQHFGRFPKVPCAPHADQTPDFTVLFDNGYGIVGEIKNLPLSDDGVDDSCVQIGKYHELAQLPGPDGTPVAVQQIDVVVFVPHGDSNRAVDRIITERFLNDTHPSRRPQPMTMPVIVGHTRNPENYAFVRNRDPNNGQIRDGVLNDFLNVQGFKAANAFWTPTKVNNRFVNDPVPPLYMATVIGTGIFPIVVGDGQEAEVDAATIKALLVTQYGRASLRDVEKGLQLLARSGHITPTKTDHRYKVKRPRVTGRQEFHEQVAERATSSAAGGKISRATAAPTPTAPSAQESLF